MSRRLIVIVTAFAVFGASAILVWRAFDPTGTDGAPRSTFGQEHQPPDWVVRAAIQAATNNQDPNPTSAFWILTDSNIVNAAVDPSAATGGARGQEYLVVLYGSFTDRNATGLGAPPTGSVIAFALDPQTHVVTDFGLTSQPVHLAGLQAFTLGAHTTSVAGVRLLATSSGPNGDTALITGRLDSTGGCLSVNGEILLWPRGYGLAEREGAVWVLDDSGTAVAKMGDPLHLGGSATDLPVANRLVPGGVPASCSAAQSSTPDPYWLVGQLAMSQSSSPASVAVQEITSSDLPVVDWSNPLGRIVPSTESAAATLGFTPVEPNRVLGDPTVVSVPPAYTTGRDRAIAWVYENDPTYGTFYVEEHPTTMSQAALEAMVTCGAGEVGCSTQGWKLVTIRGNVTALLIFAPENMSAETSVSWLSDGIEYQVFGPRGSLTPEQAISIANRV